MNKYSINLIINAVFNQEKTCLTVLTRVRYVFFNGGIKKASENIYMLLSEKLLTKYLYLTRLTSIYHQSSIYLEAVMQKYKFKTENI